MKFYIIFQNPSAEKIELSSSMKRVESSTGRGVAEKQSLMQKLCSPHLGRLSHLYLYCYFDMMKPTEIPVKITLDIKHDVTILHRHTQNIH